MIKTIIIGLLNLLRRPDCLKLDGVDDCVTFPYTGMSADGGEVEFVFNRESGNTLYSEGNSTLGTKYVWIQSALQGRYDIQIVDDSGLTITKAIFSNNRDDYGKLVRLTRIGDTISLFVNDEFQSSDTWLNGIVTVDKSSIGCLSRTSDSNFLKGTYNHVRLGNRTYIHNGDFGSANLPSIPSGADGTINGATWWKKGVDENYLTPTAYRSTLVLPVENNPDQNVIYTDGTPYYPTTDPFWDPWNDGTIGFSVSRQSDETILTNGSIQLKLGLYL